MYFKNAQKRPQALTLFRRCQQVGATEVHKHFELQEEAFRILSHSSSCEHGSFV